MRLGQRFESARRLSVHWHSEIEAEKPRFTTFAEGSELELDDLASMHNCINTEVRFRALLTQDETRQLEVVRA
jgi:hypothetical protein